MQGAQRAGGGVLRPQGLNDLLVARVLTSGQDGEQVEGPAAEAGAVPGRHRLQHGQGIGGW